MHGKYGDETKKTPYVSMDGVPGFEDMAAYQKYDAMIAKIAAEAPVRVCEHELVSGAATLGAAIKHQVPAYLKGERVIRSISHVTLGFDHVLEIGVNAMEKQIIERLKEYADPYQTEVLTSMLRTVAAMRLWHSRYLDATRESKPQIYQNLLRVPFEPPRSFYEAVQGLWFLFAFTRLTGNWPGIGRIDVILGDYLARDLNSGALTLDGAREILASFFIKGCEWIMTNPAMNGGDAQHYQNIVLSGIDEHGNDVTNPVTYLVLDIVEEFGISDFPIAVRVNGQTPPELLAKMAEVMRHGGGVVAVYNEPLIIDGLTAFGYSLEEARRFANDGCWEVQVPGKTYFRYMPFDGLQILQHETLRLNGEREPAQFDDFEQLYAKYITDLNTYLTERVNLWVGRLWPDSKDTDGSWIWLKQDPCSVISLFTDGCVQSGKSYLEGGAKYTVVSPHMGGIPDVANSLYAIKKFIFDEQRMPLAEFLGILKNNWEDHEILRREIQNRYIYFGNDNDEVDRIAARVVDDFAEIVLRFNEKYPIFFPPGISTFARQIEWQFKRTASPHGYKTGDVLAGNFSPTPGTDQEGATAIIKSYCKSDLKKISNGAALDIKLFPTVVKGGAGLDAIAALIRGFVELGGFFMNLDVVNSGDLREAQKNPEAYKTLAVRVSGWSARFVTLDKGYQDMIIQRTAQGV